MQSTNFGESGEENGGGGKEGRQACDELVVPKASVIKLYKGTLRLTPIASTKARLPHSRDHKVLEGVGLCGLLYCRVGGPSADPAEPPRTEALAQTGRSGLITAK